MFKTVFDIASSAMSATRLRINTIASNIANAETTRTAEGGPYKRRDVVFAATDLNPVGFADALDEASLKNVKVAGVIADQSAPKLLYDPGHPDADKNTGMVAMPNINPVTEMVNLIEASNAYKAAAEVASVTKEMSGSLRNLAGTA
jgi:flagellar basal-body rod protein FlgC